MKTLQVSMPTSLPTTENGQLLSIPVTIPTLDDILQYAKALHAVGRPWEGTAFGWPADYTPEIREENAVFEEYDERGQPKTVTGLRWSPAIFCIGINEIWFVSLTWEFGVDAEPWVYLEDDYGYAFDEATQVKMLKKRLQEQSLVGGKLISST